MRLVADFKEEKEAYAFRQFLLSQKIESVYDLVLGEHPCYRVWVIEEEDLGKALEWAEKYQQAPNDPLFKTTPPPPQQKQQKTPPVPPAQRGLRLRLPVFTRRGPTRPYLLTRLIILVCAALFFWNGMQETLLKQKEGTLAVEMGLTPLNEALYFDQPVTFSLLNQFFQKYPISQEEDFKNLPSEAKIEYQKIAETPTWKGILEEFVSKKTARWNTLPPGSLFGKIRQGEFWRLFTPCLLHGNILHILFNLAWIWVLGKQIEERIGLFRMFLLVLFTGIFGNIAQYLMSGPLFVGISGVVMGMIGFIWIRQKKAPWEGYPLQRSTLIFIALFILAMGILEVVSLGLRYFEVVESMIPIANTAHVVGAIIGILCAYLPVFARGRSS